MHENDLIEGCIAGNRKMHALLYDRFAPKMYGVCLRYASSADDAQDLLQEGFIKVYRNLEKFRKEGSFEGWIRRVFVNTSIEHYRKKVNLNSIGENEERTIEDGNWNVLDQLAERDIIALVQNLSPGYRSVFNMYVIEGFSHKEIADMMGISEGTSKSQLARAKSILQKKVEDFLKENRKPVTRD
jgi:RNA polymerase sigma factor (sigma-70 family)